ncbi:PREDICTED: pentatricopeptide repeat-containing protein At3g20730 [Fragaria vesca subsp. vesca]|uniref:pentatricopeptide repeat-containing protein At3g20730 n=1 Tax=Fragaria vesca subsp. vesca TaxID=101020 RepID=UPI0002C341E9|nr:PREDICTED: pentatricopeptide repeat-containing protein At3g20730 [Fragaria vesca subsp. vesca]
MQSLWKRSHLQEALRLGQSYPTHLDHYYCLYMKILQLCIDERVERPGLLAHTHMITNGFASNLNLNTKLINFYCKFGRVVTAGKVFDRMPERNVVSWTSMVSGYAQSGNYEKALGVFLEMRRAGVRANQFGYGSALKACTGLRALGVGVQIQGCVLKGRFGENLFVRSALVDFHAKCGKMEDACCVFEAMSERDLVSWNAIIGGYAVQGFGEDSLRMFQKMMREGMVPDCFTFGSVLRGLAGDSGLVRISQMHGLMMQLGFGSHRSLSGSLINAYAKCGKVESAHRIYRSMIKKDIMCSTALINGYAREGNYSGGVLDLFKEMIVMNMRLDGVILCSMLNICANVASLIFGRQIHALVFKHQPSLDVALGNALVDMYAKCGEIEDANHAFDEMEEKNVVSWTSLISGYGRNGHGHKAIALYREMEREGLKPNDVTFLSLLFACSHSGLTDEGWECFSSMYSKYNIMPRAKHFSCLVDLHARAGLLEDAHNLIRHMNIKPNASLWGAILGACSNYGNKSLGEVAAMHLYDIDPEKSVNYVVLGSIYAASGAWDNALETRGLVDNRSMKKEPAHSLLQSTANKPLLFQPS